MQGHTAFEPYSIIEKLPLKIECLDTWGTKLLVGTTEGYLLMYDVKEAEGRSGYAVSHLDSRKGFAKKPITQLRVCEQYNILLTLSDGFIHVHNLTTLEPITQLKQTKGTLLFAVSHQHTYQEAYHPQLAEALSPPPATSPSSHHASETVSPSTDAPETRRGGTWGATPQPADHGLGMGGFGDLVSDAQAETEDVARRSASHQRDIEQSTDTQSIKQQAPPLPLRLAAATKKKIFVFEYQFIADLSGAAVLSAPRMGSAAGHREFVEAKEITVNDVPRCLVWCGPTALIMGTKKEYTHFQFGEADESASSGTGQVHEYGSRGGSGSRLGAVHATELFPSGRSGQPNATRLDQAREALLSKDAISIFVGQDGKPARTFGITWSDVPSQLAFAHPHVLAPLSRFLEVRQAGKPERERGSVKASGGGSLVQAVPVRASLLVSGCACMCDDAYATAALEPSTLVGNAAIPRHPSISAPPAHMDHPSDGRMNGIALDELDGGPVFAASSGQIWRLRTVPLAHQVEELIANGAYEEALLLCDHFMEPNHPRQHERVLRTHRLHGLRLFAQRQYRQAMEHFAAAQADVRAVLALFPGIGDADLFTRHRFPECVGGSRHPAIPPPEGKDVEKALFALIDFLTQARASPQWESYYPPSSPDRSCIDTALLKAYLRASPALVGAYIRTAKCQVDVNDARQLLLSAGRRAELVQLYKSRGMHRRALELLAKAGQEPRGPGSDGGTSLAGVGPTVEYLRSLSLDARHQDLVFEFSKWVLGTDPDEGLRIFTQLSDAEHPIPSSASSSSLAGVAAPPASAAGLALGVGGPGAYPVSPPASASPSAFGATPSDSVPRRPMDRARILGHLRAHGRIRRGSPMAASAASLGTDLPTRFLEFCVHEAHDTNAEFHNELVFAYLDTILALTEQINSSPSPVPQAPDPSAHGPGAAPSAEGEEQAAPASASASPSPTSPTGTASPAASGDIPVPEASDETREAAKRLADTRQKLLAFLAESTGYSPEKMLSRFPFDQLYEERALLLSRIGQHEAALSIYAYTLKNPELAEQYCDRHWQRAVSQSKPKVIPTTPTDTGAGSGSRGRSDSARGQSGGGDISALFGPAVDNDARAVYLALLRVYLRPPVAGQAPMIEPALSLLTRFVDRIDAGKALELLPPETPMTILEPMLTSVLRRNTTTRRNSQVVRNLLRSENLQVMNRLLGARARMIRVSEEAMCPLCHKRMGNSAFASFPDTETSVHLGCYHKMSSGDGAGPSGMGAGSGVGTSPHPSVEDVGASGSGGMGMNLGPGGGGMGFGMGMGMGDYR